MAPSSTDTSPSLEVRQKTATSELSSLSRVSHRLALVDSTERLTTVLDKLLPRLLKRIGENHKEQLNLARQQQGGHLKETHDKIHAKLVEMLGHTMKRVRDDQKCQLPCRDMLQLLLEEDELGVPAAEKEGSSEGKKGGNESTSMTIPRAKSVVDPFTLNLSLAFLTLGLPRCASSEDVEELLPGLLVLAGQYSGLASIRTAAKKMQSHQVAHLLLRSVEQLIQYEKDLAKPSVVGIQKKATSDSNKKGQDHKWMAMAREVCQKDPQASGAVFDLLLDGMLYQPVPINSNIPPSGLSQAGHERLKSGNSLTARDWAAEKATRMKLMEFKLALLDFVAPSRRWALFMGNNNHNGTNASEAQASVSKTVALLVAASGDPNPEVAQRATTYLKMHHDSYRGQDATTQANTPNGGREESNSNNDSETPSIAATAAGDSMRLTCSLLSLAIGQSNAESALSKLNFGGNTAAWLGLPPDPPTSTDSSQLILSLKRRAASESSVASIMNYVADRVLDNPHVFDNDTAVALQATKISTLPVLAAQRTLSNLRTSSGQTILQAKAYVAAAKLLNILCVRLTTCYDTISVKEEEEDANSNGLEEKGVLDILARALATACAVLAPASSPRATSSAPSGSSSMEGSIAIRDACYGVVCSLSRSRFVSAKESYIFTRGYTNKAMENGGNNALLVSIDTASLLFGCVANEEEVLRPRATAALDALLGAYSRVYLNDNDPPHDETVEMAEKEEEPMSTPLNPWANPVSDVNITRSNDKNNDTIVMDNQAVTKSLIPLLWSASQPSQPKASRVAGARWASDFIKKLDVASASHLLCFLAGDADVTASSIARESGLGLPSKLKISSDDDDDYAEGSSNNVGLPDFGEYTSRIFPAKSTQGTPSEFWRQQYWDFSFAGKAATLRFGLKCLFADMYGGEDDAVKVFVSALAETLILFGSKASGVASCVQGNKDAIDLLEECTRCLVATLATSTYARYLLVKSSSRSDGEVSLSLEDIEFLALTANSSRARRHLAGSCGELYDDKALWCKSEKPLLLQDWLEKTSVYKTLEDCSSKWKDMQHNLFMIGEVHGAAFLGAQCFRAFRLKAVASGSDTSPIEASCWTSASQFIDHLGSGTQHSDEVVCNACADGLASAFNYASIDAPILDARLYDGTASALTNLAAALLKYSGSNNIDAPRTAKLAIATGKCLAASTSGAGAKSDGTSVDLGPARLSCVDALFSLLGSQAFRADEEVALVAGEALALYADTPVGAVWSSHLSEWPKDFDEKQAKELPPFQHALFELIRKTYASNSPHKRTACAPALLGIVGRAANGANKHKNYSQRPLVTEVKRNMAEVQTVFIALLSDPKSKHLSRESCCLGLAACRGLTTKETGLVAVAGGSNGDFSTEQLNHRLLRAFGQTTNFGGSAYQETAQQAAQRRAAEQAENGGSTVMEQFGEESEVGGVSGLGESSLNSYKEMAEAAVKIGRLDVLYALLLLSVSHEAWFSAANKYKYSAASLLGDDSIAGSGTNTLALRVALRPHLGKLLPRILRACHDPNKQTREQMASLWVGLTGGGSESRAVITQHLLPTVDTLIEDSTSKFWRARTGACAALAEILVGRSWEDLGGGPAELNDDDIHTKAASSKLTAGVRLLRLFRVSMRALDDVRGNVRDAGETLARTIRGLSIRMCTKTLKDSSNGSAPTKEELKAHERNAGAASATTLRWLIKNGLNQQCAEATGICLSCLVEIIDVVSAKILAPLIPDLLKNLLSAMSGLEPSALNYLQVRSGAQDAGSALSYDNLERVRLRLAQSGPLAAAVTKLLGMLPSVSLQTQKDVVPELDSALRHSVGFASRAATADAVSALCNSIPDAFRFPGASNTNPSVRLLRALYFASEREHGQGARDKMAHALGNLAALCPGSAVRVLASKACEKYNSSTGNNHDPALRKASAAALRSIAVRATNQFTDGGKSDIWFRRVLPCAFLGKKDSDVKIAGLWSEVWEEGTLAVNSSHGSTDDDFGSIEEKLLPHLVQECCRALGDLSWTRRVSGANGLLDLSQRNILAPAPRRLASSTPGKREQRRAQASSTALKTCIDLLSKSRLWTGKSEVVVAAGSVAAKWALALVNEKSDVRAVLGWAGDENLCHWQPILVAPGQFTKDLFVGDGWFSQKADEQVGMEAAEGKALGTAMEVDSETEGKLDFDECDKLTDNEDGAGFEKSEELIIESEARMPTFAGFVLFLMDQAMPMSVSKHISDSEEFLPYRVAAFKGSRVLMASLAGSSTAVVSQKKEVYSGLAPRLLSLCDVDKKSDVPPVVVASAIDCLAACFWQGMNSENGIEGSATLEMLELAKLLRATGGEKQPAWTIREATRLCLGELASNCHPNVLRDHKFVSALVECAADAQKDRKFWKVRYSGLKLLCALVARAGSRAIVAGSQNAEEQERQLTLEGMLPQKEAIMKVARKSLTDPESKVTALSSEMIGMMAWWP